MLFNTLTANLLAESQLEKKGVEIRSKNGTRRFLDNGTEVMQAKLHGGHYFLCGEFVPAASEQSIYATQDDPVRLLHQRMNCLGIRGMERLIRENMVDGLDIKLPIRDFSCDICKLGKAVRQPFVNSTHGQMPHPLDLIHIFLWNILFVSGELSM